jgi:Fe-S oxidoreductase
MSDSDIVYIFCDEFTNYNDAETGIKLILLLRKLGYHPMLTDHSESGRSYMSKGLIDEAKKIAIQNVTKLSLLVNDEKPLIGIEPSAILSFRDEYPDLVTENLGLAAKSLSKNTFTFEEWFSKEIEKGKINRMSFHSEEKELLIHGHCHQKALTDINLSKRILSLPENYKVSILNTGCCGMAGSFGFEKEHYEVSQKTGELILFPSVRNAEKETIIVAAGTSCRHQILDGTGRKSFHPAEVLYNALSIRGGLN